MSQTRDGFCEMLRRCVKGATEKRQTKTAVFYAEKLVTLSSTPDDVYIFAQALYDNEEYRRAVAVINQYRLTLRNCRFTCLVGRCLLNCKAYEDCIHAIGGEDDADEREFEEAETAPGWLATLFVIRAQAWEALENLEVAVMWYKKALKMDPYCYEAFQALVENHMLSQKDGAYFIEGLLCSSDITWIKALYSCINAKYAEVFEATVMHLKESVKFLDASVPLRPSDQTNRSRQSHTDSHRSSSPGVTDQPENLEADVVDSGRTSLENSIDVQLARAEWHYSRGSNTKAFVITKRLLQKSEETLQIYPLHLAVCLELKKTPELYILGQALARLCPESALAFYAFGVYYMSVKNYTAARKAFSRSNSLDRYFAPAWIALGNAFAAQSETEQALAAYRTAQSLFPGLHLPSVYIGMENLRLNLLESAKVNFETAYNLCPGDPLPLAQLGMVQYYRAEYKEATESFLRALARVPSTERNPQWEPIHVNLGHAMRKEKRFKEALKHYNIALSLCPFEPGTYNAIGFVYHLQNQFSKAMENYLRARIYAPHDIFSTEMSELAAKESLDFQDT